MIILSWKLVQTLKEKIEQGKEENTQPMSNILIFPIHVGVPPL
jgi:hypothetical protein